MSPSPALTCRSLLAAAAICLLAAPCTSSAQQANNLKLNIAAGLALPTSSFADRNDAGYDLTVGVGVRQPGSQLGFRAEGLYTEYNAKRFNGEKSHAGGVTANLLYDLAAPNTRQPGNTIYLIGGVGYYSTRDVFSDNGGNIGWNVGGGFRFPLTGFDAYLEARYHTVSSTSVTFVPITFGLVF